jgi:IS30 family transposase
MRYHPLTPEQIEHAIKAYQAGNSSKMIGDLLGVDASTVWRTLRREGVEMRDCHGRQQQY